MTNLSRILALVMPFAVAGLLSAAAVAAPSGITALTPHPDEHLAEPPAVIAAQVPPSPRSAIGKTGVHFLLDGRDVSDAITVAGARVEYKPPKPLSAGEHAVEVAVVDATGGRLAYTWTFTVDGAPAQKASSGAATSANAGSPNPTQDANQYAPSVSDEPEQPAPQTVFQQNYYGGFSPLGSGPYYWGDRAAFMFTGAPGGYGFLTFGGIPGVFDLLPLGVNTFYAIVPIPVGFIFVNPFVTCHFFTPAGTPIVSTLPSFPIVHRRRVALEPPVRSLPVARSAPSQRMTMRRAVAIAGTLATTRVGSHLVPRPAFRRPLHLVSRPRLVARLVRRLR